jgi:hypothetical protein
MYLRSMCRSAAEWQAVCRVQVRARRGKPVLAARRVGRRTGTPVPVLGTPVPKPAAKVVNSEGFHPQPLAGVLRQGCAGGGGR